jgi:membrane protein implicated in regulation of membrane protease activity
LIAVGLVLLVTGLGALFAMLLQLLPTSLWLAFTAYAASMGGVLLAAFQLAARLRGRAHRREPGIQRSKTERTWN